MHRLVTGDERLAELATIRPGDSLNISVDEAGELTSLRYSPSRVETVEATLEDGNWRVENVVREYQRRTRFAEVASSLGSTGKLLGRWAGGRGGALVGAVVPTAVKTRAKKVAVGVAARAARARD